MSNKAIDRVKYWDSQSIGCLFVYPERKISGCLAARSEGDLRIIRGIYICMPASIGMKSG